MTDLSRILACLFFFCTRSGLKCNIHQNPQREELIQATDVIVWDEFIASSRDCLDAIFAARSLNHLQGKVMLCAGDFKQILPVVKNASKLQVLEATMSKSPLWDRFEKFQLYGNMRLQTTGSTEEKTKLIQYSKILQCVGLNTPDNVNVFESVSANDFEENNPLRGDDDFIKELIVPAFHNFFDYSDHKESPTEEELCRFENKTNKALITWLYQNERGPVSDVTEDTPIPVYDPVVCGKRVILAATNDRVNHWNNIVGARNPSPEFNLIADNVFSEVDDDLGHLASMLTDRVLEKYDTHQVPPQQLRLKVGDICIILRNIDVDNGITNNTRVRILKIHAKRIRVQTIDDNPKVFNLPRIKFKFKLAYGRSFELTRTQFPLRRAFAMTIHKSQGQTIERVAFDIQEPLFAHGQTYVAISRVRNYQDIAFIVKKKNLTRSFTDTGILVGTPVIVLTNVVYKEAIRASSLR